MKAATVYALFSVSYECLFYAALGASALAWLVLERCCQKVAVADWWGPLRVAAAGAEAEAGEGEREGELQGEGPGGAEGEGEGRGAGEREGAVSLSSSSELRVLNVGDVRQGLTLVHFSPQPEPFLTQITPCTSPNAP